MSERPCEVIWNLEHCARKRKRSKIGREPILESEELRREERIG